MPFWALELGDHAVTAVRVRRTPDDALEVLAWWTVPVPPGEDPAPVALKSIRRRGLRDHGFQVILQGRGTTCRSCRIAPEDADLTTGELEHELHDFTPFEADEVLLRTRRLGGAGVLDFRVVAERRSELGRVEEAFEEAGVSHIGLSVGPAALLAAVETLGLGPPRGFALEVRGDWSVLTAMDGALSIRYPVPFGLRDAARTLRGAGLEPALDDVEGDGAARALAAALDPLGQDLRRAMDFHRAASHGSGEFPLALLGPGAERPGLRRALAASMPSLAPPPRLDPAGKIRPGPRVDPRALEAALPAIAVPLGAAASAAGIAPRDLDFRNLPDDLPPPSEGTLFPVASAVVVAGLGLAFFLATQEKAVMAEARAAVAAIPAPAPPGAMPPEEALAKAGQLRALADRALARAALRRSLAAVVAAFPRADEAPALAFGAEGIRVSAEGGNYRARLDLRVAGAPLAGEAERERLAPLRASLEPAGWRLVEIRAGVASFERLELRAEPLRR